MCQRAQLGSLASKIVIPTLEISKITVKAMMSGVVIFGRLTGFFKNWRKFIPASIAFFEVVGV